jgi:arginine decarboxylase-like protein
MVTKNEIGKDDTYWGRSRYMGVVLAISDTEITLKNEGGEMVEVVFNLEKYNIEITPLSEIEFGDMIRKKIKDLREAVKSRQESLAEAEAWEVVYETKVTLMGRILKMAKEALGYDRG